MFKHVVRRGKNMKKMLRIIIAIAIITMILVSVKAKINHGHGTVSLNDLNQQIMIKENV